MEKVTNLEFSVDACRCKIDEIASFMASWTRPESGPAPDPGQEPTRKVERSTQTCGNTALEVLRAVLQPTLEVPTRTWCDHLQPVDVPSEVLDSWYGTGRTRSYTTRYDGYPVQVKLGTTTTFTKFAKVEGTCKTAFLQTGVNTWSKVEDRVPITRVTHIAPWAESDGEIRHVHKVVVLVHRQHVPMHSTRSDQSQHKPRYSPWDAAPAAEGAAPRSGGNTSPFFREQICGWCGQGCRTAVGTKGTDIRSR